MYTTNKKFLLFYCSVLVGLIAVIALVAANHTPKPPRCQYRIRIDDNKAYTYDNDEKLIGVSDHGFGEMHGIDSVINKDNE